jgi:NADPH2:quinone reductase
MVDPINANMEESAMRVIEATRFGGPEVLVMRERSDPTAGPGQAVVNVAAVPVLFVDTQIRSGRARDWFAVTPPYVPGAGVGGAVASVGEGVDPAWIGRRVVADASAGGYLEQAVVATTDLVAVPDGLGTAEAAALLHDGRTAMGLVESAALQSEGWVLVLGAGGGLGSLLIQLAHRSGARVIGAAGRHETRQLARDLGADAAVDSSAQGWAEQVLAITGGSGPNVIFDGVGGEIGRAAFGICADGGWFSAHGAPSGGFAPINPGEAARRKIVLRGIEHVQFSPSDSQRFISLVLSEAAASRLRPVIGQRFALERAVDAHAAVESRDVVGKTLLEV